MWALIDAVLVVIEIVAELIYSKKDKRAEMRRRTGKRYNKNGEES